MEQVARLCAETSTYVHALLRAHRVYNTRAAHTTGIKRGQRDSSARIDLTAAHEAGRGHSRRLSPGAPSSGRLAGGNRRRNGSGPTVEFGARAEYGGMERAPGAVCVHSSATRREWFRAYLTITGY